MAYCVSVEDLDLSSAYGTSGCCASVGGYPSAYGASIRLAARVTYLQSSGCLLAVKWMPTCSQVDAYLQSQVDACLRSSGCLLALK